MRSDIVSNILERINHPELLSTLVDELSGSELNSILLEVFHQKTRSLTSPGLLNKYQQNRFVQPADLPVLKMKRMEMDILELFDQHSFPPVELSPVSILGCCSVMGPVNQNKVLSALRGTEVLADSTNAIALHACDLKQKGRITETNAGVWMRCSNIQRQLRSQQITFKGFRPHFKIGCLVTFGSDIGSYTFEKQSLLEHMLLMKSLFLDYFKVQDVSFRLLGRSGYEESHTFLQELRGFLQHDPRISFSVIEQEAENTNYYHGVQYKVDIRVQGKVYEIGDGGFVNWTQRLLQNKKERMLSTGFGFDLMYRIQAGEI